MTGSKLRAMGIFLALAFLLGSLAGPGGARAAEYKWKMATLAPDSVGYARQMKKIVFPVIEQETNGELQIKVYWGGIMGDDEDYIKKMRIGQLHGAGFSGQGATLACPDMTVVELPFLFENWEEVDFIKNKMRPQFDKLLAESGYFALAWTDQDFDQLYSTRHDLNSLEAFKKARFMTWYGPLEEALFTALGASAVPVNVPEASASLRQGVVDAAIGPAIWVVGAQMYTVVKYVYPMKIRYSPGLILVTLEAWDMLPENYQKRFQAIRFDLEAEYVKEIRKDNEKCLAAVLKYGIREGRIAPKDLEAIKERAKSTWYELADKVYPKATLDELLVMLEDFRAQNNK
ncbi:MAG: TRAP transporter substrate-binding protein DctP [Pseudomonadota bacterium]